MAVPSAIDPGVNSFGGVHGQHDGRKSVGDATLFGPKNERIAPARRFLLVSPGSMARLPLWL